MIIRHARALTISQRRWMDERLADIDDRVAPEHLADRARPAKAAADVTGAHRDTRLYTQPAFDGSLQLHGTFDAVTGAPILAALTAATNHDGHDGHDGHDEAVAPWRCGVGLSG